MSEHLTQTQIENYRGRGFSPVELRSVLHHLADCEMCRRRMEVALDGEYEYLDLRAELTGVAESDLQPAHLTFAETAGFVDGTLAGEELRVATDHLSCCEECRLAVEDLRAFRVELAAGLADEYHPSASAPSKNAWLVWPSLRWKSPAFVLGSALAALLLSATGWLSWREWQRLGRKPAITNVSILRTGSPAALPSPGRESSLVVMLNDGDGRVTLDRQGKVSGVEHLPVAYQRMIERALTNQLIERSPLLAELSEPGGNPRKPRGPGGRDENGGEMFSVVEPVGEATISDRPTFRWSRLESANSYQVEVFDEKLERVATSPPLAGLSWTAAEPLKRGGIYSWQVKAVKNSRLYVSPNPPVPQAKFRILDQARAEELSRSQRLYAASHLALALLYAEAGVLGNAERELRALQRANPDAPIAEQLLKQVRKLIHR